MKDTDKIIIQELRSIKLAQDYLRELTEFRKQQGLRAAEVEKVLLTRLSRIERLSKISLHSLYRKFLGERDRLLEIHKQHYLDSMLEFNELEKSIRKLDFEIEVLMRRVAKFDKVVWKLKEQLRQREIRANSPNLKELKRVLARIDNRLGLITEIEEAIREGSALNRKFNAAIRFVEVKAKEVYKENKDMQAMLDFNVRRIDRYQEHMISIQHCMLKFEKELNDVYLQILDDTSYQSSLGDYLMKEYRLNLINDINENKTLEHSHQFLKSHKSMVLSLTRSLRSDLRRLKKELAELEGREEEIIGML